MDESPDVDCVDFLNSKHRPTVGTVDECRISSSMASSLWRLQQQGIFCDTTIAARDGITLSAHAVILAAASDQLCHTLRNAWSFDCGLLRYRLDLSDCDASVLNTVLSYIYTGIVAVLPSSTSMKIGSTETNVEVQEICDRFGITMTDQHVHHVDPTRNVTLDDVAQLIASYDHEDVSGSISAASANKSTSHETNINGECKASRITHSEVQTQTSSSFSSLLEYSAIGDKPADRDIDRYLPLPVTEENLSVEELIIIKADPSDCIQDTPDSAADVSNTPMSKPIIEVAEEKRTVRTSRRTFQCDVCLETFSVKSHLTEHSRTHVKSCAMCTRTFSDDVRLQRHMVRSHKMVSGKGVKHKCSECQRRFVSALDLTKHMSDAHNAKFVCNFCGTSFLVASHLRQHMAAHYNEDDIVDIVLKSSVLQIDLGAAASQKDKLECATCSRRFVLVSQLRRHERTHNTDSLNPYSCVACARGFTTATALAEHRGSAHGADRPHRCTKCPRRFAIAATLEQHVRVHEAEEQRSDAPLFQCKTCTKVFRCATYLRNHEHMHTNGTRPFVCDVCGKGFIGSSNLTTHRRIHTGERPYACTVCNKRFLQLCAVREHEKIHVGQKQFICESCGKQFMTYAQLYNHARTHGGIKDFSCDVCSKRFYTNGDLVKHARIHADRRPFVCDVCGKGFKYSSNLHGHARIHTGSRPFVCGTCGKGFTYSSHLSRHAKLHVREKIEITDDLLPSPSAGLGACTSLTMLGTLPVQVDGVGHGGTADLVMSTQPAGMTLQTLLFDGVVTNFALAHSAFGANAMC